MSKRHDFRDEYFGALNVFSFALNISSEIFLILRVTKLDIIIDVQRYSRNVPDIVIRF